MKIESEHVLVKLHELAPTSNSEGLYEQHVVIKRGTNTQLLCHQTQVFISNNTSFYLVCPDSVVRLLSEDSR